MNAAALRQQPYSHVPYEIIDPRPSPWKWVLLAGGGLFGLYGGAGCGSSAILILGFLWKSGALFSPVLPVMFKLAVLFVIVITILILVVGIAFGASEIAPRVAGIKDMQSIRAATCRRAEYTGQCGMEKVDLAMAWFGLHVLPVPVAFLAGMVAGVPLGVLQGLFMLPETMEAMASAPGIG